MELVRSNLLPREILTREALENAIAVCRVHGRLDQRRPAPAGHRPRGRRAARDRRLRSDQRTGAAARGPQAWRAVRRDRSVSCRRHSARCQAAARGGTPARGARGPSRAGRLARRLRRRSKRRARRSCRPLANPLKATGGLVILKGNLAPEGCVREGGGTRIGCTTAVPRACSTASRPRWRPCSPTASSRTTSS